MAKKSNVPAGHPRGCKCSKCAKHPTKCRCRPCRFKVRRNRWRRRRFRHAVSIPPRRRGWAPYSPEDENKVREDIFDKVYKYFEVGTYEAVVRECRKLVQTCDLCKGTGIDKGKQDPANPQDPRLCPRCSEARDALRVLDGLRESASDVKPKAVLKEQP